MLRIWVILCALATVAFAHTKVGGQVVPRELREAMAVVSVLYPDLVGQSQHVSLTGTEQVRVDIRERDELGREFIPRALVSVDLRFDRTGLVELRADGPYVSGQSNAELRRRLGASVTGSERDAVGWLRDNGARFGPDRAPTFDRTAEDVRRLLGVSGTVQAGGFRWRDPRTGQADPGWVVALNGSEASGALRAYTMVLEPITGRVVRLSLESR